MNYEGVGTQSDYSAGDEHQDKDITMVDESAKPSISKGTVPVVETTIFT